MAQHARAARALLFMQQCRKQAAAPYRVSHRYYNASSLEPENFGKRMRDSPVDSENSGRLQLSQQKYPSDELGTSAQPAKLPYDFPRARDQPIPRYRHNPAVTPGLWSFFKYRLLRMSEPPNPHLTSKPAFNVLTNPYRAQKSWPPILSAMSELQQFHYEKKFRRRLLRKTYAMRYTWDTWALFLRRFSVGFLIFYFALVAEPPDPNTRVPPDGLRYWMYGQLRKGTEAGVWPDRLGEWIDEKYQYYRLKHKRQWDPYNHDGWDETRPRNSLPGVASPAVNRPLQDPTVEI